MSESHTRILGYSFSRAEGGSPMLCLLWHLRNKFPSPRGCTTDTDEPTCEPFVPWGQPGGGAFYPSISYPYRLHLNLTLSLESYIHISFCTSQESLSHKVWLIRLIALFPLVLGLTLGLCTRWSSILTLTHIPSLLTFF